MVLEAWLLWKLPRLGLTKVLVCRINKYAVSDQYLDINIKEESLPQDADILSKYWMAAISAIKFP